MRRMSQLSIAAGPTDIPLLDTTIATNLAATVAAHGDREALVSCHQGVRWTYSEFGDRVHRLATGLLAAGLRRGDRVGLWSPNFAEWTLVQYATAELGVVLVNVNPAYRTHELTYALDQSGCRWLIAAPEFKTSDYRAMTDSVRPDLPALERAVFFWDDDWEQLCAGDESRSADVRAITAELDPDDPINIQYTSGTTGFPKGATLTHRNILNNGYFVTGGQELVPGDRLCIPVPFYHCFGMVMGNLGCTSRGVTMVIPGDAFDPAAVLQAVQDERCTALYGVPTMFIAEMALDDFTDYDLSSLRTGVMAGSLCPVEVMKRCISEMNLRDIGICYGMTETSPVSTQTLPGDTLEHRTESVGVVHPHVEIRVVDPSTGETLPRGETGEFCTRGYSVMQGYWNDEEKTAAAIDADGWMHTGDLAVMADDGYVNIVGRIKDMVIRGGENIYPREIEEFLYTHPDIEDVQAIGVPDERFGEELMVWVKPRPGASIDLDAVREFCSGRIAHFKVPRYVKVVDEFPMTVTGKIRKIEMRETSIAELGLEGTPTAG
ncbi:AMP-binding protein [Ilumatobacter coccineus]|uniref:Fatty-acid--CoA ligase n=1 Tax=Ilumatobacter coccineus (strain NBRC 103263 / KCTC 29153 / YM16-304) TaxID=1313172 RepID=A0A6C7E396_ILUCY|nr:fatty-acid--CoA ligase [Ilumatobacter coccineus YM16-304]